MMAIQFYSLTSANLDGAIQATDLSYINRCLAFFPCY